MRRELETADHIFCHFIIKSKHATQMGEEQAPRLMC